MGLVGVAKQEGCVLRRQTLTERLDGLLGSGDLRNRAAGEARCSGHAALKGPFGLAVDIVLKRLGDDRVTQDQTFADQTIDEHAGVRGRRDLPAGPLEPDRVGRRGGSVTARSTRPTSGMPGMNVPRRNTTPKNSASAGIGVTVAVVSGPRTVSCVTSRRVVTTICQRLTAIEMNVGSGSLRLVHAFSTKRESEPHSSMANNSAARFIARRPDVVGCNPPGVVSSEERLDDRRQQSAAGEIHMRGAREHGKLALRQEPHRLGGVLDVDEVGVADQDQHREPNVS